MPIRRAVVPLALAILAAGLLAGCSEQADRAAAQAYFDAYGKRDAAAAGSKTTNPTAADAALSRSFTALPEATPSFRIDAVTDQKAASSTVRYTATWTFPRIRRTWTYSGTLPMTKAPHGWLVAWSPADVAPGLQDGQHLASRRTQPPRAALNDRSGQPLFTEQPVVTIGIDPGKVTDLASLATTLASVPQLQTTAAEVVQTVQAAGQGFAPLITLRRDVYEQIKPRIYDLPGTAFRESSELLPPATDFAEPLLGRVGPATAEQVQKSQGTITAGDQVGQGGLQEALNAKLAGTPGLVVVAIDAQGNTARTLAQISQPTPGTPVTLTLDRTVQTAADATIADVALPAAIVATQPSTGQIVAVANNAAANGDIALTGQYPPGSTFKIVTYTAALTTDPSLTLDTPEQCPGTITVNGQTIRNENVFDLGSVPLRNAFAFSCNTTAARLALSLPAGGLARAAASLGLGQKWTLPVPAFSGSMPGDAQQNELAAEGYGQGKTLVSPLLMAEIVGGTATGTSIAPSLILPQPGPKLPAQSSTVTNNLNALMRDVVTVPGATGHELASLPGTVEGKTGTAEFGSDNPPKAHSWFVGTRGDLAFAVFVYGGENSTSTAVLLAKTFLQKLGS